MFADCGQDFQEMLSSFLALADRALLWPFVAFDSSRGQFVQRSVVKMGTRCAVYV